MNEKEAGADRRVLEFYDPAKPDETHGWIALVTNKAGKQLLVCDHRQPGLAEDLVRQTPQLSPDRYKQLRTTTVGQLREAGFELVASGTWPHYDIVLADLEAETVERLRACFGPPFPNPVGARDWGSHDVGFVDRLSSSRA